MQVAIESPESGVVVIRPSGGLEMNNISALRQTLQAEVQRAERGVILALAEVPFMDSSGIAVLIEGLKWSRERSLPYILAHLTTDVQMVIELARLENFFTITEDLAGALALIANAS